MTEATTTIAQAEAEDQSSPTTIAQAEAEAIAAIQPTLDRIEDWKKADPIQINGNSNWVEVYKHMQPRVIDENRLGVVSFSVVTLQSELPFYSLATYAKPVTGYPNSYNLSTDDKRLKGLFDNSMGMTVRALYSRSYPVSLFVFKQYWAQLAKQTIDSIISIMQQAAANEPHNYRVLEESLDLNHVAYTDPLDFLARIGDYLSWSGSSGCPKMLQNIVNSDYVPLDERKKFNRLMMELYYFILYTFLQCLVEEDSDEKIGTVLGMKEDLVGCNISASGFLFDFLSDFILITGPYLGYRTEQVSENPSADYLNYFGINENEHNQLIKTWGLQGLANRLKDRISQEFDFGTQPIDTFNGKLIDVIVYKCLNHVYRLLRDGCVNHQTQFRLDDIVTNYVAGLTRIFVMLNDQLCEEVSRIIFSSPVVPYTAGFADVASRSLPAGAIPWDYTWSLDAISNGAALFSETGTMFIAMLMPLIHTANTGNDQQLHRLDGPAVEHRCGFGQYYIDGHEVAPYIVENPDQITAKEIFLERNAEIRAIMIRQLTPVKFIEKAQTEATVNVLDQGEGDNFGSNFPCSLIEVIYNGDDNPDLREPIKFLIVSWPEKNKGYDQTAIPVDPEITTCADAQRWVSGLKEWNPLHQEA